ncbi:HDOD domain-containing protein [Marinomonas algicola]|uniref:HDOD domain-containing protein n=1 Tax=Marinomonas algicola TaxID=2773454 RepID=UPI00174EC861|nr:HDOD domain-containing protein [Marinomonas algicola]
MEINTLLNQTSKLPNIPEIVRELIQTLNSEHANHAEIAQKVAKDQTISLKVLRLVNSAQFGLSRKVSSIDEAIVLLGMEKLKTLVIASGFSGSASNVDGLDTKRFWKDSFQVASLAKWLALRTPKVDADIAFTAGVIYNIGRLLLHLAEPNKAKAIETLISETKVSRTAAELERLGFTTQDAGKALLDMWQFPQALSNAVQQYKKPLAFDPASPLSAVLNLACYLNASIREDRDPDIVKEFVPKKVLELAGIDPMIIDELDEALCLESGLDDLII